jgi:hypothetical protein
MRIVAFHHPDDGFILRPVIRVKHRLHWHHEGFLDNSTLTWQIILTMPRPDDFPTVGGVSGTVTVNLGIVFRRKFAARQGIDPDDGTVGGITDIQGGEQIFGKCSLQHSRKSVHLPGYP